MRTNVSVSVHHYKGMPTWRVSSSAGSMNSAPMRLAGVGGKEKAPSTVLALGSPGPRWPSPSLSIHRVQLFR